MCVSFILCIFTLSKTNDMINTVEKFLNTTGFARGTNHPSVKTLKAKMRELKIKRDLKIDVMTFFLYDNKSK